MTKHPLEYVTEEVHEISRLQDINAELLAALEAAQPILKRAAGMAREKLSAPYIVAELEHVEEQARAAIANARKE